MTQSRPPDATLARWRRKGLDLRYGPAWYKYRDGRPPLDDDRDYVWSVAAQCWQVEDSDADGEKERT